MPVDEEPTRGPARAMVPTVTAPSGPPPAPPPAPPSGGDGDGGGPEPSEPSKTKKPRSLRRTVIEWVVLLGGALVIALLIKTFLFQAFYIPSESMTPTLEKNDRVLVNKLSYKLHDVNRGDIVVFEAPNGEGGAQDLVKRVIGLPGEMVSSCDSGKVCVDGHPLEESYLADGTQTTGPINAVAGCANVQRDPRAGCEVPAGTVFVMGDNRGASKDSRSFGPVDEDAIVGRVFIRIWPPNRVGLL
jgi:signal peptidase I